MTVPAPFLAFWQHPGGHVGPPLYSFSRVKGSYSAFPSMTGVRSQFFSVLWLKWLLSQSRLSCHFVHFPVLWLEKASPPSHHDLCWLFQVASSFSSTSRIYLAKRKSKQLTTRHYSGSWVCLSCLLLFTFQNHPTFVLYIMPTVFVVLGENTEKYN